mmetsp:Transcript_64348/g.182721  ORF Transcript_64348/g.182721 Transcript_64348/m.182721 type:complete len:527 (+) Transcript_64348:55-1635(+)
MVAFGFTLLLLVSCAWAVRDDTKAARDETKDESANTLATMAPPDKCLTDLEWVFVKSRDTNNFANQPYYSGRPLSDSAKAASAEQSTTFPTDPLYQIKFSPGNQGYGLYEKDTLANFATVFADIVVANEPGLPLSPSTAKLWSDNTDTRCLRWSELDYDAMPKKSIWCENCQPNELGNAIVCAGTQDLCHCTASTPEKDNWMDIRGSEGGTSALSYFRATLSSLAARHPELIKDMVQEAEDGVYNVKFFMLGEMIEVQVDSRILLHEKGGYFNSLPLYMAVGPKQAFWPVVVQKGWLKLFGRDRMVRAGSDDQWLTTAWSRFRASCDEFEHMNGAPCLSVSTVLSTDPGEEAEAKKKEHYKRLQRFVNKYIIKKKYPATVRFGTAQKVEREVYAVIGGEFKDDAVQHAYVTVVNTLAKDTRLFELAQKNDYMTEDDLVQASAGAFKMPWGSFIVSVAEIHTSFYDPAYANSEQVKMDFGKKLTARFTAQFDAATPETYYVSLRWVPRRLLGACFEGQGAANSHAGS